MKDIISNGSTIVLSLLISWTLFKALVSKDISKIWSPLTTISLVYFYYCLWPYYFAISEKHAINESIHNGYLFHMAALLSYVCILVGFKIKVPFGFKNWNKLITNQNCNKCGLVLFLFVMLCYVPFRGLHFSISKGDETIELDKGGLIYYFISTIDMFAASLTLLCIKGKSSLRNKIIPIWLILSTTLFAGVRWRLVVIIISVLTMMHLYPKKKKPNYILLIILAVVVFLGFSAMDIMRTYNQGIVFERATELDFKSVSKGAGENYDVYSFSMRTMNKLHESEIRVYFLPLIQAILMPIPRYIFPSKPNAEHLHQMESIILGDDTQGAAFLNFVEGYMAFGWAGVVVYGLILGWISKCFWSNYKRSPDSISAILLLGLFSGVSYTIISRGEMASAFVNIMYVILLPLLLLQLFKNIRLLK